MRLIGLTGGIGAGKSTVSKYLKQKNIYVIDADEISRETTAEGGVALPAIRELLGDRVFYEDGNLNRRKVADIVFNDKELLAKYKKITTDLVINNVWDTVTRLEKESKTDIVVVDAPLLFECLSDMKFSETWLVTCDFEKRLERIRKRDGASLEDVRNRVKNQMSDENKKKLATHIIDNSSTTEELYKKIDELLGKK